MLRRNDERRKKQEETERKAFPKAAGVAYLAERGEERLSQ